MTDRKKQIEEMAKERNEIKDIMKLLDKCVSLNPMCTSEVAIVIYGNNYRKIPEDSVVLTKGAYESISSKAKANVVNAVEIRKETAREILTEMFECINCFGVDYVDIREKLEELAKQHGVDLEE